MSAGAQLTTVRLYGKLGRFGKTWRLDVGTPREAVGAIDALRPGFKRAILEMGDCDFGVTVGGRRKKNQISEDKLDFPHRGKTITITPVVRGSGNSKGWLYVVAGVILVAVGLYTGFAPATMLGISLILGGVSQLLTPSPRTATGDATDKSRPSYQFSGIVNTIGQGECVPVLYGRLWIGSAVVSAAYRSEDITQGSTSGGTTSQNPGGAAEPFAGDRPGQLPP